MLQGSFVLTTLCSTLEWEVSCVCPWACTADRLWCCIPTSTHTACLPAELRTHDNMETSNYPRKEACSHFRGPSCDIQGRSWGLVLTIMACWGGFTVDQHGSSSYSFPSSLPNPGLCEVRTHLWAVLIAFATIFTSVRNTMVNTLCSL